MNRQAFLLSAALCAGAAHAQSSVTLYGVTGGGARWLNNTKGGATVQYSSIESQNRLGFRGLEDLGAGVQTLFVLENTYSTGNGSFGRTGTLFDTAAYVGFVGHGGRLTFGRQLSAAEDLIVELDPDRVGGSNVAITPNAVTGTNVFTGDTRFNNMAKYKNVWGGVGVGASYSVGGAAGNLRAGGSYSLTASYQTDRVFGGASYQRTYNADASQMAQMFQAGGYLRVGTARVYLSYLQLRVSGDATSPQQRLDQVPQGGVAWQVTPFLLLTAAFYDDIARLGAGSGAGGHKTTCYGIADYFLSKTTNLYVEVDRNTFTGAYRNDPTNLALFSRNPTTTAATGVTVGLTTRF